MSPGWTAFTIRCIAWSSVGAPAPFRVQTAGRAASLRKALACPPGRAGRQRAPRAPPLPRPLLGPGRPPHALGGGIWRAPARPPVGEAWCCGLCIARQRVGVRARTRGHPRPAWDDHIAAFHDHGILPDETWQEVRQKTLGRDYWRRVRARLLELWEPLCQRWDDLWLRRLGPWSPPSHLPQTCHLCGECDTVSSAAPTGANRCAQCSQVAACPWPEPPAGPHRRTEEEALQRRIRGAHAPSHKRGGPAGAALLWIHMHLWDPTSVAHLLHVVGPPRLARICWVPAAQAVQLDVTLAGAPDRQALAECVAQSRVVGLCEGVLPGKVGLLGVVAVYGRSRSSWFDVHRGGPRQDEAIPGLPCRLPTHGLPVWHSRRVCAAVCRRISAAAPLRYLEGPSVGMVPFLCR